MPNDVSRCVRTFSFAIGCQKFGQPVPDSNLVLESNSTVSQDAMVQAVRVIEGVLASAGTLGTRLPGDLELFRRQLLLPFRQGLFDLLRLNYTGAHPGGVELDDANSPGSIGCGAERERGRHTCSKSF
jgi:hypothetical protein